ADPVPAETAFESNPPCEIPAPAPPGCSARSLPGFLAERLLRESLWQTGPRAPAARPFGLPPPTAPARILAARSIAKAHLQSASVEPSVIRTLCLPIARQRHDHIPIPIVRVANRRAIGIL